MMTHRQFSRNAASSRAIPVNKLIQDVIDDPFVPLHWGANQKGMQADQECDQTVAVWNTGEGWRYIHKLEAWLKACDAAVQVAESFNAAGYHKQIVNRLLEPFAHITVVVSGTEWSNFLALRDHKDAEPHIQILAQEVRKELDREDNIQILEPGQWHLPFANSGVDKTNAEARITSNGMLRKVPMPDEINELLIKMAVACCASTSYKTVDGFDMTFDKAIELHDKLVGSAPLHASPAEHVAQADMLSKDVIFDNDGCWIGEEKVWDQPQLHGNFSGFIQYRKQLPNECL